MGARYTTSNPRSAIRGSSAHASAKLPLRPGSGPADRGNISYQAPKRARSRSTQTRLDGDVVARERSAYRAIRVASSPSIPLRSEERRVGKEWRDGGWCAEEDK